MTRREARACLIRVRTRRYLYGLTAAALAVAAAYDYVNAAQFAAWNTLAAAVLSIAAVNTRTPPGAREPLDDDDPNQQT